MAWWAWLVLGLLLLGGEMLLPGGFFLLFFGAGSLLVGVVLVAGLELPSWGQWLLFSVFSLATLAFVRPRIVGRLRHGEPGIEDTLVGEIAVASEAMAPGAVARGELRGSVFSLRNASTVALVAGERCRVVRVDGLTLDVVGERTAP